MAKKLPFKTAPSRETRVVGNERFGELEFPVYGDLTVREQAWINDELKKKSTFIELARIANKVAKAEKIQPIAAHRFLTKCATSALSVASGGGPEAEFDSKEENLRIKYSREIEDLCDFLLKTQWHRQCVTAAALIRFRLEGMSNFTTADCEDLSQGLVTEIFGFSLIEQGAAIEEEVEEVSDEKIEEDLGK